MANYLPNFASFFASVTLGSGTKKFRRKLEQIPTLAEKIVQLPFVVNRCCNAFLRFLKRNLPPKDFLCLFFAKTLNVERVYRKGAYMSAMLIRIFARVFGMLPSYSFPVILICLPFHHICSFPPSHMGQFLQDGKNDQTLSKKNIFCRFTVTKRFDFFNFSQLF